MSAYGIHLQRLSFQQSTQHIVLYHHCKVRTAKQQLVSRAVVTSCHDNSLFGSVYNGSARVRHVIDQNRDLALHVTYKHHRRHLIGFLAFLVDQRKVNVQLIGNRRHSVHNNTLIATQFVQVYTVMYILNSVKTHRFAPPASGETTTQFLHSGILSLIHLSTAGSANRLSTGISKKP